MASRVVVWGTGNVGRPALRAVAAHRDLDLAGVVVSNPAKV
ncbi:MAG: dihydrodipicolinate reductase, partial [Acidimicrobiia bacterium]|nr:dihydrodipicolinate reductase [Acidimicrobiia bacterium]